MKYILQIWKKVKTNGCKPGLEEMKRNNIEYFNVFLTISFVVYCAFAIVLFFINVLSTEVYFISTSILIAGFCLVYFLTTKYFIVAAKNLMLFLVFTGIFFYDINIGKWAGVYLYYFAFFAAAVNVFLGKKERYWLIFYLIFPTILILVTETYHLSSQKIGIRNSALSTFIYVFNFCMTLLIVASSAIIIIRENLATQKSLKTARLNVQSLIDNTQGYIWSIDMNYKLIAFSNSYKEIIKKHYNVDCYEGLDVNLILDLPNNPKGIRDIYTKILKGEILTAEYFSNKNYFELQASPFFSDDGLQTGATFHSRMITDRKLREEELQQSKINLETLIDTVGNSIWSITRDYKIIAANKMYVSDMKRIFNADIQAGFDVSTLFKSPNYPAGWENQYATVFNGENLFLDYIFDEEYFELNAVPIRNVNKEIVGAVFFSRNITERKVIEQELTKARINAEEATKAKAQFLSNMSHELRTPLNGIVGLTNILQSETYLPSQTNHLEILKYSSDNMLVLINDILDFSKIEAGKVVLEKEPFNLLDTLNKLYSFFTVEAANKGLAFEMDAPDYLNRNVKADVTRLRQVLTNLLSNAIKFTEKGKVVFSVEIIKQISDKRCCIRYSIKDTGIGIESNKLNQIFESFGQADLSTIRKYGGSGLGLTISKKLITLMGTELQLESVIDKGSSFWFDLEMECTISEPVSSKKSLVKEIKGLDNIHILVVEDNVINMMVATKILKKWNIIISKANNGAEAVDLVSKNNYDVILMDLQMPIMDGLTATSIIRETNKMTPIIALTATTDEMFTRSLNAKGINDVLQKPFLPEDLYNKIVSILGNHKIFNNTI
jgi:signal transduction histidine kinase/ActR/RegA family two-component response regulator